jgi:hypothetical protein
MQKQAPPATQPAGKSKDFAMLKAFKEIKAKIGTDAYYKILGANGYEKSDDITDTSKGRSIYAEMQSCLKAQQEHAAQEPEPQQAPQPAVGIADLPEELWAEGRD